MKWTLTSERPIYWQLMEQIRQQIIKGDYQPGDRLPSVRELAAEAAVNPNTMQKALTGLEQTGLISAQRTNGHFITEDPERIRAMKKQIAQGYAREFLQNMRSLGYSKEQMDLLMQEIEGEEYL